MDHIQKERIALQKHFKAKRDHVLKRLHAMGLDVKVPPVATFYVNNSCQRLPEVTMSTDTWVLSSVDLAQFGAIAPALE